MNFFSQSSNTLIPKCEGKNMFDLAGTGVQASQLSVNMGLCGKHLTILLLSSIFYFRLEKKKMNVPQSMVSSCEVTSYSFS